MFDKRAADAGSCTTADLVAFAEGLRRMPVGESEGEHVERLRLLEDLKSVCAAVQAREAAALRAARWDAEAARDVPAAQRCRGLGAEIALARRDAPTRGSRHLGLALALTGEMPHTMAALTAGSISEWRATLIARETAWLPVDGRRHVDAVLTSSLTGAGDRAVAARARAVAQAYDPAAAAAHLAYAADERRVSIRPAPDTMVHLSALLPTTCGVAAYAALHRDAASALATGQAEGRTRSQVMADLFVERLTGQATADAVPVEIHLLMTDSALYGASRAGLDGAGGAGLDGTSDTTPQGASGVPVRMGDGTVRDTDTTATDADANDAAKATNATSDAAATAVRPSSPAVPEHPMLDGAVLEGAVLDPAALEGHVLDPAEAPAWLVGYGPIPAPTARALLDPARDDPNRARVWLRRLYADPETGQLVAMDSHRRLFDGQLRRMVVLRDDTCRTPWCDAPIRHADHATAHHDGGPTTFDNASGPCEACNHAKELDRWRHEATATT